MKKGYHSTQRKMWGTVPASQFYGFVLGYAVACIIMGLLRWESTFFPIICAMIGLGIGYWYDKKYFMEKDEPYVEEEESEEGAAAEDTTETVPADKNASEAAKAEASVPDAAKMEESASEAGAAAEETADADAAAAESGERSETTVATDEETTGDPDEENR